MLAEYQVYGSLVDEENGDYGVRAVCEITFVNPDGSKIVGTKIASPGVWGVAGYSDESHFDSLLEEEYIVLADMLNAILDVPAWEIIPDEAKWESSIKS